MPSAKRERQREGRQVRVALAIAEQKRRQRWRTLRNFGIVFLAIVAVIFFFSYVNGGDDKSTVTAASSASTDTGDTTGTTGTTLPPTPFAFGTGPCPNADGSSPRTIDFTAAPMNCLDAGKTYTATFDTTAGKIVVNLDTDTSPGTANNFVVLSRYHYFDGTTFYRAAQSIGIIQGGAPHDNTSADKGPGYDLQDEGFDFDALPKDGTGAASGGPYSYSPGDLVMARRAVANGASADFFFAVNAQAASLNSAGVYVKFGATTEGADVLAAILASAPGDDQPPTPTVTINTVTITET